MTIFHGKKFWRQDAVTVSKRGKSLKETMECVQKEEWTCEHEEGDYLEQINMKWENLYVYLWKSSFSFICGFVKFNVKVSLPLLVGAG